MAEAALHATREQILAYRLRSSYLDKRLSFSAESLHGAGWAGLTDSMPRAALLSLHARVDSVDPRGWEHPSLVQVWGPRFSAYVVAADDWAPFTLGRMPRSGGRRKTAEEIVTRLADFLGRERMEYSAAGHAMGVQPNSLRYGTLTGRVMIRWEGSGKPLIWLVDPPDISEDDARRELARRYLHVFGVGTAGSFGSWAGVNTTQAKLTFEEVAAELIPVSSPVGAGFALASQEADLRAKAGGSSEVRLIPSGDNYYLLNGADRELLVPDDTRRPELWTSRVWPGAVLIGNEVVGIWRRRKSKVTISAWRDLSQAQKQRIEAEAEAFPLEEQPISILWD